MWPSKASPALGCLLIVVVPLLLSILLSLFQSSPARPAARDAVSATASPPLSSVIPSVPGCGGSVRECSGSSNSALIDNMVRRGLITSPSIAAAMKRVDRAHYITRADLPAGRVSPSTSQASAAYVDSPQYIGYGATISAPHMHAMCTELMLPALERAPAGEERRVLDVGSGSGYLAAVLSRVLGDTGRVYGVEHIPELVDASVKNLQADDPSLLQRVHIQPGDGSDAEADALHYHPERPQPSPHCTLTRLTHRCGVVAVCCAWQAAGPGERCSVRCDPRGRRSRYGAAGVDGSAEGGRGAGHPSGRGRWRADAGAHREAAGRSAEEEDSHRRALRAPHLG